MPTVAICICTRDRPDDLAMTLRSIAGSSLPVRQVVVSDDGSDQRTPDVCADAPIRVDYVPGPRRGLGPNRNRVAAVATTDFILFLDDDCRLGPHFVERALACMTEHERQVGSGRVIVSGTEVKNDHVVRAAAQTFLGFQSRRYGADERLSSVVINSTLFPRRLFDTHHFDEQIRYGYDEVDLASRAVAHGYRIVHCESAINEHHPSAHGRDDYAGVVVAARLFVTLKRYALTERRYGRALAFALVAPVHTVGSGAKAGGFAGAVDGFRAVWLAGSYARRHLRARLDRRPR